MLEWLARHRFLHELVTSTLIGVSVYVVCAVTILTAEWLQHRDLSVYRSRNALNDLAYVVFYQCSIYNLLVSPLFAWLAPRLQFLRVGVMLDLPPVPAFLAVWLLYDFLNYWLHRAQHSFHPLWAFHSVHHTQTRLTLLTGSRIHFLEQLYSGVLMIVPVFLLGIPQPRWLPILFVQLFSESMQHARLNWSFGRLHRFVVSPAAHAVHHSTDARDHHGNYGRIFMIWDVLFGTFVPAEARERRFGVDGMEVPERLTAQLIHPFRVLTGRA